VTSSVSLIQPTLTFLKDELDWSSRKAIMVVGAINLAVTGFIILTIGFGTLDELDFWAGSVLPVVSGLVMIVLFGHFLGIDRGFKEMHRGAELRVPRVYRFIMKYVTPSYMIFLLIFWAIQDWWPLATMQNITDPRQFLIIGITRGLLLGLVLLLIYMVYVANRRHKFPQVGKED
jgi:NSS family neurotransmitter:Na+ symporter